LQGDALEHAGCYRVFTDAASDAATARPALDQILDQLRPGDTLVVWKLDWLDRSGRQKRQPYLTFASAAVSWAVSQAVSRRRTVPPS
jgi:DNA invertase Pin-like site-specific DNA recombinase